MSRLVARIHTFVWHVWHGTLIRFHLLARSPARSPHLARFGLANRKSSSSVSATHDTLNSCTRAITRSISVHPTLRIVGARARIDTTPPPPPPRIHLHPTPPHSRAQVSWPPHRKRPSPPTAPPCRIHITPWVLPSAHPHRVSLVLECSRSSRSSSSSLTHPTQTPSSETHQIPRLSFGARPVFCLFPSHNPYSPRTLAYLPRAPLPLGPPLANLSSASAQLSSARSSRPLLSPLRATAIGPSPRARHRHRYNQKLRQQGELASDRPWSHTHLVFPVTPVHTVRFSAPPWPPSFLPSPHRTTDDRRLDDRQTDTH